ncbi:MAG: DUF2786 domain-containing protein [Myxococcales bacterium]|nr:DUF2786 domain-containing protein [Myxococcales bacterium]
MPSPSVEQITSELEALLVRELLRTWHAVNNSHFKRALRPPVMRLTNAAGIFGRWHREPRTLELERAFVTSAAWGEVVEVLKHEMAHQYVHEVLGALDETAHGPAFAAACKRIGIDASASGRPRAGTEEPELDRIRQRVTHLLALATSDNQHEAENAAALAQRLMLTHNIAACSRPEKRHHGYRQLGEPRGRIPEGEHILAAILADHFFVEAIWVSALRVRDGKRGTVLELCGSPENLEIAEYVHAFLARTAERLWREHQRATRTRSNQERRGYVAGVMEGFRERLAKEKTKNREAGLVWVGDAELHGYFRCRHPHVRTVRLRGHGPSDARSSGREAGRQLHLHHGVSDRSASHDGAATRALPPKR